MEQTEIFTFFSAFQLESSVRTRVHYERNTTAGTSCGPFRLPDLQDNASTWHMTFKDKKQLYGEARILPSGRPECDADLINSGVTRAVQARRDQDVEPVTYHGHHRVLWEELVHQVGPKGHLKTVVDLTPLEPTLMMLCVEWKIPYIGICLTEHHRESVKRQLTKMVFAAFSDPRSPLHNPAVRALMSGGKTQGIPSSVHEQQELGDMGGDDDGMDLPLPDSNKQPKPRGGEPAGKRAKRGGSSLRQSMLDTVFSAAADASGVKEEPVINDD